MSLTKEQLNKKVSIEYLIEMAQILKSDNNQNPEYDRALTELIAINISCKQPTEIEELLEEINELL